MIAHKRQSMNDPHANTPLATSGPEPKSAAAVVVLLHGRGGSADDMLVLFEQLELPNLAAVAPQAAGHTWYPQSFLAPLAANQPYLDSALKRVDSVVTDLIVQGISSERIALMGFSQGACLTVEYVARHPRKYGAVMGLTGGLIGPPGTPRNYSGSLAPTPVFLGTSDPDPHVPFARVKETQDVLTKMGAVVELRRYPGMPHTINEDEMQACRALLVALESRR
jgi:predicted esterase